MTSEGTYGNAHVGNDAVANVEVLDVLALLDDLADRLVAGDKLHACPGVGEQGRGRGSRKLRNVPGTWR